MRIRAGFTLMEMVMVIAISGVLVSIAMNTLSVARRAADVRSAAETMVSMGARARAMAVARGVPARLDVDMVGDSAWISQNGQRVEIVRFAQDRRIDIRAYKDRISICMSPRGFADVECNNYTGVRDLVFANDWHAKEVKLFPLGQMFLES